jgi:hypothetical protein
VADTSPAGSPPAAPASGLPPGAGQRAAGIHLTGLAVSATVTLVWLGLSWWHPAVTYHFGPPLAALAWPMTVRARVHGPTGRRTALTAAGYGLLAAMAGLGIAMAAHWLRGPTLIGWGSVPAEEVVLSVVAAAWGWRVAERRRRSWFLPAEPGR